MDPFSVGAASIAIIETCLKTGKLLIRKYDDYKGADQDVAENLLKLKALWNRSEVQMGLLSEIWSSLEPSHQQNQHIVLSLLESKLNKALRLLDGIIGVRSENPNLQDVLRKKKKLKRGPYAFSVKASLDEAIAEFVEWQNIFDPSWYLLAKLSNETLDRYLNSEDISRRQDPNTALMNLRKSIRDLATASEQPSKDISSNDFLEERLSIPYSSTAIAQFNHKPHYAIVDRMTLDPAADVDATTKDVKALCKALSRMDPSTLGLLRCCGVIKKTFSFASPENTTTAFDLVFDIPTGLNTPPTSLRGLLLADSAQPSINARLTTARHLAASILYLNTAGFVHKNIRPETILLFPSGGAPHDHRAVFLAGFESFRLSDTATHLTSDALPARDLYRHPSRQGHKPQETYALPHDTYSLGVCLLELGLWTSFLRYSADAEGDAAIMDALKAPQTPDPRRRALATKKRLLVLAAEQLPAHMGARYTEVVINCLTCLDEPLVPPPPPQAHTAGDDIARGVQFVDEVLTALHEIAV